jgi:hypothetical protein
MTKIRRKSRSSPAANWPALGAAPRAGLAFFYRDPLALLRRQSRQSALIHGGVAGTAAGCSGVCFSVVEQSAAVFIFASVRKE